MTFISARSRTMSNPTVVSRRIEDALSALQRNEHERSLIHLFPAIDKTAKRRRPSAGVAERIKGFLNDEEVLISAIAFNNIITFNSVNGYSFAAAIYKFGRTAIAHEGELDPRLKFSADGSLSIGDVWTLPIAYISAMCIAVVVAPECAHEKIGDGYVFNGLNLKSKVNDLWGKKSEMQRHISNIYRADDLFGRA